MSWLYALERQSKKRKPKREKQSKLPKKPRFEPRSKIIPGNHPVIFKKAKEV